MATLCHIESINALSLLTTNLVAVALWWTGTHLSTHTHTHTHTHTPHCCTHLW